MCSIVCVCVCVCAHAPLHVCTSVCVYQHFFKRVCLTLTVLSYVRPQVSNNKKVHLHASSLCVRFVPVSSPYWPWGGPLVVVPPGGDSPGGDSPGGDPAVGLPPGGGPPVGDPPGGGPPRGWGPHGSSPSSLPCSSHVSFPWFAQWFLPNATWVNAAVLAQW